jgi:RNA polymerase sigma-70 factor (ECF subfamily)
MVAQLPPRQKTALVLCFYEERSNREAAEIMGVSLKALQSLLIRAKRTLKEQMGSFSAAGE